MSTLRTAVAFRGEKKHHTFSQWPPGPGYKAKEGAGMLKSTGRSLPLSLARRLGCDLIHLARQVPSVPVQRRMNLARLVELRQAAQPRPSWCAIFTKAYAFVNAGCPELRRAYVSW